MKTSKIIILALLSLLNVNVVNAAETITGTQLQKLLDGRKAVDVTRDDHWIQLNADGTGIIASRGIEFPTKYEDIEHGMCRTMSIPRGAKVNEQRFEKVKHRCQKIRVDGLTVQFINNNGFVSNTYEIRYTALTPKPEISRV